jgi:hypothetical protein
MQYESRVFRIQFPLVKFFVQHLIYHRELGRLYDIKQLKSPFWVSMIDAQLVRAVIYWCMVFGTDGLNQTHWKNLSTSNAADLRRSFRERILARTGLTEESWDTYWKELVAFRNEYVAHRQLEYKKPVPILDSALEVAYVYDSWVRDVIAPDIMEDPPLGEFATELQMTIRPYLTDVLTKTTPPLNA